MIFFSYRTELASHGIKSLETPKLPDVNLTLPKLKGDNIEEHFLNIAKEQAGPYQELIASIVNSQLPEMPKVNFKSSFTESSVKFYYFRPGHLHLAGHATIERKVHTLFLTLMKMP